VFSDRCAQATHGSNHDRRRPPARFPQVNPGVVGLAGLEPGTSSLSGIEAQRCADRRFPRWLASVRGEGMRSNNLPGPAIDALSWHAGKICHQPVACEVMELPVGAAGPWTT